MATQGIDFAPVVEVQTPVISSCSEPQLTIALISGSPLLYIGLQRIVAGTAFQVTETISVVSLHLFGDLPEPPALFIIDANRYTARMIEIAGLVKAQFPTARLVALADRFDPHRVWSWYKAGIDGFCLMAGSGEVLVNSLELVMLGEAVLPSAVTRPILAEIASRPDTHPRNRDGTTEAQFPDLRGRKLTAREADILRCLMEGVSNKIIARRLDVTEATIKVHVKAILRKVGVLNRTQAALWASGHLPTRGDKRIEIGTDRS